MGKDTFLERVESELFEICPEDIPCPLFIFGDIKNNKNANADSIFLAFLSGWYPDGILRLWFCLSRSVL